MKQKKIAADLASWIESQKPTGRTLISAIELTFENHFEPKEKMESSSSLLERARKLESEATSFASCLRDRSRIQFEAISNEVILDTPVLTGNLYILKNPIPAMKVCMDDAISNSDKKLICLGFTFEEIKSLEWNEVEESIKEAWVTGNVHNRLQMIINFVKLLEQQLPENSHDA
ncbi:hypothetical protein QTG68_003984 [Vibrio vulnificus]|nr:hypothetical protein [Vibrio vulnificus]